MRNKTTIIIAAIFIVQIAIAATAWFYLKDSITFVTATYEEPGVPATPLPALPPPTLTPSQNQPAPTVPPRAPRPAAPASLAATPVPQPTSTPVPTPTPEIDYSLPEPQGTNQQADSAADADSAAPPFFPTRSNIAIVEQELFNYINEGRASNDLPPLTRLLNPTLQQFTREQHAACSLSPYLPDGENIELRYARDGNQNINMNISTGQFFCQEEAPVNMTFDQVITAAKGAVTGHCLLRLGDEYKLLPERCGPISLSENSISSCQINHNGSQYTFLHSCSDVGNISNRYNAGALGDLLSPSLADYTHISIGVTWSGARVTTNWTFSRNHMTYLGRPRANEFGVLSLKAQLTDDNVLYTPTDPITLLILHQPAPQPLLPAAYARATSLQTHKPVAVVLDPAETHPNPGYNLTQIRAERIEHPNDSVTASHTVPTSAHAADTAWNMQNNSRVHEPTFTVPYETALQWNNNHRDRNFDISVNMANIFNQYGHGAYTIAIYANQATINDEGRVATRNILLSTYRLLRY